MAMIAILFVLGIAIPAVLLLRRYPINLGTVSWLPQRAFAYILAFAAMLAVLFATSTLLGLLAGTLTNQIGAMLSAEDARNSASLSLAALAIGLPIWLGLWTREQRRAATSPDERHALERLLFLGAVFASTAIVALFALQTLLQAVLTLPGPVNEHVSTLDSFSAGTRLVVFGMVWFFYARLGRRERGPQARDPAHDLAVYAVAGFALGLSWYGLGEVVRRIAVDLFGENLPNNLYQPSHAAWTIWGEAAAWLLAGGVVWAAFLRYDLARGGRRLLRVLYLYAVLAYAAVMTLGVGVATISEILRRIFGAHPLEGDWVFLSDSLPWILSGGFVLAVHWLILRHQSALVDAPEPVPGGIPWPRRPALATVTLAGITMATVGICMMIWVGLDALCGSAATQTGSNWWRDTLSIGIAMGLVGAIVWLRAWLPVQRAAAAAPARERSALERRLLMWSVVTVSTLSALGFTIALLWLLMRTVLGGTQDATTLANALQYLSAAAITAGLAAYHGLILRQDRAYMPPRVRHVRVVAYVVSGAEDVLEELRLRSGAHIEVAGYLASGAAGAAADMITLQQQLAALETRDHADGALLILQEGGGTLYPYTQSAALQPSGSEEPTESASTVKERVAAGA